MDICWCIVSRTSMSFVRQSIIISKPGGGGGYLPQIPNFGRYTGVDKWGGGVISDFKENTENVLRTNARERSDQARGSEATERGEGVPR